MRLSLGRHEILPSDLFKHILDQNNLRVNSDFKFA
jgi:hypothetical protein